LTSFGLAFWMALTGWLSTTGVFESRPMPAIPLFFSFILTSAAAFALSPIGRAIAERIRLSTLVAFQAFRLPLELVLHSWVAQGSIPETMTWSGSGQNFDIIAGAIALFFAPMSARSHKVAWFVNIVTFALLLNVGRVAMFSSPVAFGWGVEPPLMLAASFPYVWIGSICVAGAFAGQIILTRALLARRG
jgi:hypothetical protein